MKPQTDQTYDSTFFRIFFLLFGRNIFKKENLCGWPYQSNNTVLSNYLISFRGTLGQLADTFVLFSFCFSFSLVFRKNNNQKSMYLQHDCSNWVHFLLKIRLAKSIDLRSLKFKKTPCHGIWQLKWNLSTKKIHRNFR